MKLILHPGHAKCGSTTIQKAILRNRGMLERNKIYFPDSDFRFSFDFGHNSRSDTPRPFFKSIAEKNDVSILEEKLKALQLSSSKNDCEVIILSAENLTNQINKPIGKSIHSVLSDFFDDVKIVYYVRRQDDFIVSAWQQWGHKTGEGFEDYVSRFTRGLNPNYLSIIKALERIYQKKVEVAFLDSRSLHADGLVSDFFYRCGIDLESLKLKDVKINETVNPYLCELLAEMPHLYNSIHDPSVRRRLQGTVIGKELLVRKAKYFWSSSDRQDCLSHYERQNIELVKIYFERLEYSDLFALPSSEKDERVLRDQEKDLYRTDLLKLLLENLLISSSDV